MKASAARRGAMMAVKGLLSFRVLMALATSFSVTAVVAGPMAYQAAKARDEVVIVAAAKVPELTTTTTTTEPVIDPTTTSTSTTTSSTTTTTTIAGARPTAPSTTTTSTSVPPLTGTGLFASVQADHRNPVPLDGGRAKSEVWIFFDGPGVTSVRYWIDDPAGAGTPTRVASGPFDLAPDGLDVRLAYGLGSHTLLAEVTTLDGTYRRLATFDVVG